MNVLMSVERTYHMNEVQVSSLRRMIMQFWRKITCCCSHCSTQWNKSMNANDDERPVTVYQGLKTVTSDVLDGLLVICQVVEYSAKLLPVTAVFQ